MTVRGGRRSRRARTNNGGASSLLPDAPLTISSLAAWYDSRTDAYFTFGTGSQISAWASRAGSLGSIPLSQATSGNQPTRATGVATLNSKQSVLFDGTDDFMAASTASDWTFLHDNTGATIFTVERIDSTGVAGQTIYCTVNGAAANKGMYQSFNTTNVITRVCNGSGTYQNGDWTNSTAAYYARDVSRWRGWSYGSGVVKQYISGASVSNNDTGGQTPATTAPQLALTVGRTTSAAVSFKGYLAQMIVFKKVLSAGELTLLANWANRIYGVTA